MTNPLFHHFATYVASMCRLREAAAALRSALHRRPGQVARRAAVAAAALSYAIHFGTLAHPFLLADNRCAPPYPCLLVLIMFPKAMHDLHLAYCRGSSRQTNRRCHAWEWLPSPCCGCVTL